MKTGTARRISDADPRAIAFRDLAEAQAKTFTDVHVISTAMADRLVKVLGPARGIGARATIGVQSLAGNHCYESWIEVEIR